MTDLSSYHHAPEEHGSRFAVKVALFASGVGLLGLAILTVILFPPDVVLAASTAILAAATVVLAIVAVVQHHRRT